MTEKSQQAVSSGYTFLYDAASYVNARDLPRHDVPFVRATAESVKGYGNPVTDFHTESVTRVTWPKTSGWRQLTPGTGERQPNMEPDVNMHWEGDLIYCDILKPNGEIDMTFATGRTTSETGSRDYVLTSDAHYHPDGGQVLCSKNGRPFVMLLASAAVGDDVKLEDFTAFWFDGSFGFQIAPNTWHTPPYITDDVVEFLDKQSSVFARVGMNTVEEFGKYLNIPLTPPLITV